MKTRAVFAHWLLALVLLLSQQLAAMHSIVHIGDTRAHTTQEKQLPTEKACSQCMAFAQIGSALTGTLFAVHDNGIDDSARIVSPNLQAVAAPPLAFHSRAPPVVI